MENKRKRGSTLCEHCGCSNGNRAFTCKVCHKPLPGRAEKIPRLAKQSRDVSALTAGLPGVPCNTRVFSCRVRREGPDYRTFVTESRGEWRCWYKDCSTAQDARKRSSVTGVTTPGFHCQHIQSIQEEISSEADGTFPSIPLDTDILPELPFPPSIKTDLLKLKESGSSLIERVSSESFAVCDKGCSQEHPLALLHVRFRKCDTSEPRPTFYCPCHSFQRFSAQLTGPATTAKPSRRCLHFCICLWAFASKSCLAQEFSFLTMNHESDGPSLSAGMYAYASMVILLDKK